MGQSATGADFTRSAILACIGSLGPTSRAGLARYLGVSPALITQKTKQLLADGLLVELEHAPSVGGRPAQLLGLATDAGGAIGVKLVADHVTLVEVGIGGAILRSQTQPFDAAAPTAIPALVGVVRQFVESATSQRLLGIGVGVPGDVDEQGIGTVDSTQLGWQHVPLGQALRTALELPVLVDNNVNAMAVAERLYGQARGQDHALVVTIGTGVGGGLIADGAVYRGSSGGAGEIGHIPALEDGPLCQCGARGCLEALVGQQALVAEGQRRGVIGRDAGIEGLRAQADRGDQRAQEVFSAAGHLLGRALAGLVNALDPEVVIISGEGVDAWRHWSFGFEPALRSGVVPRKRGIPVAVEAWHDDRWAQGAASLILATPFDSQGVSGDQGERVRARLSAVRRGKDTR